MVRFTEGFDYCRVALQRFDVDFAGEGVVGEFLAGKWYRRGLVVEGRFSGVRWIVEGRFGERGWLVEGRLGEGWWIVEGRLGERGWLVVTRKAEWVFGRRKGCLERYFS